MTGNSNTDNSTLTRSACAIVFILFVFIYLYFFQADLLSMEQHVLSGGTTRYNRTAGALLITLVLFLIQIGVRKKFTGFNDSLCAFNYFPSLLFLSALTAAGQDFDKNPVSETRLFFSLLLLILYVIFVLLCKNKMAFTGMLSSKTASMGILWKNLLFLFIMFLLACAGGNTDKVLHYRLRMESLLGSGDYTGALHVGEKSYDTDGSLTMLRIYALSKNRQLGDKLFEYPIPDGGSRSLLPDGKDIKCLFFPEPEIFKQLGKRKKGDMSSLDYLLYLEERGLAMKAVSDYILCGHLLDKDLDSFAHEIKKKYNLDPVSLPKHYKEALTLYTHLRANPVYVFHDEVMDADYADFQKTERTYKDSTEKASHVRDSYGETYWFYYFYR